MKRNALILGVVFSLLATACGAQATPTANPVDIQHTAEAAAFTMVAQTQESLPSATPLPPTNTPIPTIVATNTPLPTLTPDGLGTALPTAAGITPAANIPTFKMIGRFIQIKRYRNRSPRRIDNSNDCFPAFG